MVRISYVVYPLVALACLCGLSLGSPKAATPDDKDGSAIGGRQSIAADAEGGLVEADTGASPNSAHISSSLRSRRPDQSMPLLGKQDDAAVAAVTETKHHLATLQSHISSGADELDNLLERAKADYVVDGAVKEEPVETSVSALKGIVKDLFSYQSIIGNMMMRFDATQPGTNRQLQEDNEDIFQHLERERSHKDYSTANSQPTSDPQPTSESQNPPAPQKSQAASSSSDRIQGDTFLSQVPLQLKDLTSYIQHSERAQHQVGLPRISPLLGDDGNRRLSELDRCPLECGDTNYSCNCRKLARCARDLTVNDHAILMLQGYIILDGDDRGTLTDYPKLFDGSKDKRTLSAKIADIQTYSNNILSSLDPDTTTCDNLLASFHIPCKSASCSTVNTESYSVSIDRVCDTINDQTLLRFSEIARAFDKYVETDCKAMFPTSAEVRRRIGLTTSQATEEDINIFDACVIDGENEKDAFDTCEQGLKDNGITPADDEAVNVVRRGAKKALDEAVGVGGPCVNLEKSGSSAYNDNCVQNWEDCANDHCQKASENESKISLEACKQFVTCTEDLFRAGKAARPQLITNEEYPFRCEIAGPTNRPFPEKWDKLQWPRRWRFTAPDVHGAKKLGVAQSDCDSDKDRFFEYFPKDYGRKIEGTFELKDRSGTNVLAKRTYSFTARDGVFRGLYNPNPIRGDLKFRG